jgi:predicted dinucleotide-binding enzyme
MNESAVDGADFVVLAVNASSALETARQVASAISAPLLCVASVIRFVKNIGALPDLDSRSLAERVQDEVAVPVVAGLHSIAAASLLKSRPEEDALICGDDAEAKSLGLLLAQRMIKGHALDAGPLASARALEGMTAVIVNLNRRYGAHAGLRVSGMPISPLPRTRP